LNTQRNKAWLRYAAILGFVTSLIAMDRLSAVNAPQPTLLICAWICIFFGVILVVGLLRRGAGRIERIVGVKEQPADKVRTNDSRVKPRTARQKRTRVVWIALILLIASWLYPPWVSGRYYISSHPDGFYFLFDSWNTGMQVDWLRLGLIDLIVVAIAGGRLFTLRTDRNT
jgi:hypothetical protein